MARPRHTHSRTSSIRRLTTWNLGPFGTVTAAAAGHVVFPTSIQAAVDGLTIVRIRGELLVYLSAADNPKSGFRWAFGMGIVTENAAGIGVTAVPSPIADAGWNGWMVYETGTVRAWDPIPATGNNSNSGSSMARILIDSKAMRKIKLTDVLIGVFAATDETFVATIDADLSSRMLFKLP